MNPAVQPMPDAVPIALPETLGQPKTNGNSR